MIQLFYSFPLSLHFTKYKRISKKKAMSNVKEQIEAFSTKVEDIVDRIGQPLKPYIPAISRFLIIATFIEDSLRIIAQWKDQLLFMQEVRSFPRGLSHLFLGLNVLVSLKKEGVKNF